MASASCAAPAAMHADPGATQSAAESTETASAGAGGRLRAPDLACDRNHLTSYSGRVTAYTRDADSTWLRIATDEDTVEEVRVPHAGARDGAAHFMLRRAPFPADGLASIETAPGTLRAGMRAVAWVCDDGRTPAVIDWQPAEAGGH